MPEPRPAGSKGPRGKYSRLICLGCRERRIRCELPSGVELPNRGELRTVETPCYRCERLGIPCVIRQTTLGRPGPEKLSGLVKGYWSARSGDTDSRIVIELPSQTIVRAQRADEEDDAHLSNRSVVPRAGIQSADHLPSTQRDPVHWGQETLLIHKPQSAETTLLIRAVDTLRYEKVEEEWYRHLPAYVGHSQVLDLSIKAIVCACAFGRGVPRLTSSDCYQALALALSAVQVRIKGSDDKPDDDILASTALLAPFEGAIRKDGIPTRLHIEGLAAILAARPVTYPITQLAADILDDLACDSSIIACVQDTCSPFESVARAYYANDRRESRNSDRTQIKALGIELSVHIPRLVKLVRLLQRQQNPQNQVLLDALRLSNGLLGLHDSQLEERLLQKVELHHQGDTNCTFPFRESLNFASVRDFEVLVHYWQCRLSLLRLERRLHDRIATTASRHAFDGEVELGASLQQTNEQRANEMEMSRLVNNIVLSSEYTQTLRLRRHCRMFAHAIVVVWGVTADSPMTVSYDQRGIAMESLRPLLLRMVNATLPAKPDFTFVDMDVAADIFAGGDIEGRYAEMYGL